ncbi:MAG: SGNH/GDSL hydrolase family protein [Myxococcales bacterium]|nr:SGNH/GDSL hydrolase family protein [Myxococcales bacterium]MCB9524482.1 hypothetical protein [Myxococcales bacterium]
MAQPPRSPLWSKTGRSLWMAVAAAVCLQVLPGADALRWMPEDPWAFVPRVFRPGARADVPEDAPIDGEVDDDALLALGPSAAQVAHGAEVEGEEEGATPDAGLGPAPASADLEPSLVIAADDGLPRPPRMGRTAGGLPLLPIEDPQGSLRRLYHRLAAIERGEAHVVRVLHYGDSLLTGDYVTKTVRRLLQKRFGDAGHGFVLAGKPAPWYRRDKLHLTTSDDWEVYRLTKPKIRDGLYGLGGVTFLTHEAGAWVRFEPSGDDLGAAVSKMRVFYLAQPRGGRFELKVDDRKIEVDTRADAKVERVAEITVPDGPHVLGVRTLGHGEVRLFGAVLEREGPGVTYDALGLDGTRVRLLRKFNAEHWHTQLRQRRPDLLVLQYGTNESQLAHLGMDAYKADLTQIVGHLRAALPGVGCLLVSPLDRAEKDEHGKLVTRPVVKRIVDAQREVALKQGCAFWNTWRAMGGEGSMARWYKARPSLGRGDLTHPTWRGAERVGAMLFAALMEGYREALAKR